MNAVTDPALAAAASTPVASTTRPALAALERRDAFVARHIGPSDADQAAMLATLGYASRKSLIDAIVPAAIRRPADGPQARADPLASSSPTTCCRRRSKS